jgi:hypothetical protein
MLYLLIAFNSMVFFHGYVSAFFQQNDCFFGGNQPVPGAPRPFRLGIPGIAHPETEALIKGGLGEPSQS